MPDHMKYTCPLFEASLSDTNHARNDMSFGKNLVNTYKKKTKDKLKTLENELFCITVQLFLIYLQITCNRK
jgi:hypothetical protein